MKERKKCGRCEKDILAKGLCRYHYYQNLNERCQNCRLNVYMCGLCRICYRTRSKSLLNRSCLKCKRKIKKGKYCVLHSPKPVEKHPESVISTVDVSIEK